MNDVGALALTLSAYIISLHLRKRWTSPFTTPALTSVIFIIILLQLSRMSYADYALGQQSITVWIGPACAALGVILYKQRSVLRCNGLAFVTGLASGTAATIVVSVLLAHLMRLDRGITALLLLKSVTAAVAIQYASFMQISPALIAVVVVATGICGAVIGPALLDLLRLRDALSRGLALGCISHGIGTAQAVAEGETSGAAASLAMCLMAVAMSVAGVPLVSAFAR